MSMEEYAQLIQTFLEAGYKPAPFSGILPKAALLLRHDVLFDVSLAEKMAHQESNMGVGSTYFFVLRSASYNLLEIKTATAVDRIRQLGHKISLHYAPAPLSPEPTTSCSVSCP